MNANKNNLHETSVWPVLVMILIVAIISFIGFKQLPQKSSPSKNRQESTLSTAFFYVREFNLWQSKDGKNVQLTNDGSDYRSGSGRPQLSKDGKLLAFTRSDKNGNVSLYVTTSDEYHPKMIADDLDYASTFAWSPDSQSIYYLSSKNGNSSFENNVFTDIRPIVLVNTATSNRNDVGEMSISGECGGGTSDPAQLLANIEGVENTANGMNTFQVAPDNAFILHAMDCEGERLAKFNLATKQDSPLEPQSMRGSISPDSTRIVAVSGNSLVLSDAKTGKEVKRFKTTGTPVTIIWSTDSKKFYYSSYVKTKNVLYTSKPVQKNFEPTYSINASSIYSVDVESGLTKTEIQRDSYVLRPIFVHVPNDALIFAEIENNTKDFDPKVNVYSLKFSDKSVSSLATNAQQATYWAK